MVNLSADDGFALALIASTSNKEQQLKIINKITDKEALKIAHTLMGKVTSSKRVKATSDAIKKWAKSNKR